MEHDLSEAALTELRRIEAKSPCEVNYSVFKILWDKRYVMAGPDKTHITERGRRLVHQLDSKR